MDDTILCSSNLIPGKDVGSDPVHNIIFLDSIDVCLFFSSRIDIKFFDLRLPRPLKYDILFFYPQKDIRLLLKM